MKTAPAPVLPPAYSTRFSALAKLRGLKATLLANLLKRFQPTLPAALIKRALDEAALVAEATGFPILLLPVLAEEQVQRISTLLRASEPFRPSSHFASAA